MNEITQMSRAERYELFVETAARKSISSAVAMEKDFWVCWILSRCFEPLPLSEIVFKGGTSLSKAYHAIARFSEDIDLTVPRAILGFSGAKDLNIEASKTKQKSLLNEMTASCQSHVTNEILPALIERLTEVLGKSTTGKTWGLRVADEDRSALVFTYPAALTAETYGAGAYISPAVRLEFGGRSEVWPGEYREVQPYCLEVFPGLAMRRTCTVHVLAAERTFWEKATILHAEYYRPSTSGRGERISRHYSDLVRLSQGEIGERALEQRELLSAVARHKERYYPSPWARYSEAAGGTIRLAPHEELESALRRDYEQMREMFFEEPVAFDFIVDRLTQLEETVNAATD